jgi:hypothetical protein
MFDFDFTAYLNTGPGMVAGAATISEAAERTRFFAVQRGSRYEAMREEALAHSRDVADIALRSSATLKSQKCVACDSGNDCDCELILETNSPQWVVDGKAYPLSFLGTDDTCCLRCRRGCRVPACSNFGCDCTGPPLLDTKVKVCDELCRYLVRWAFYPAMRSEETWVDWKAELNAELSEIFTLLRLRSTFNYDDSQSALAATSLFTVTDDMNAELRARIMYIHTILMDVVHLPNGLNYDAEYARIVADLDDALVKLKELMRPWTVPSYKRRAVA